MNGPDVFAAPDAAPNGSPPHAPPDSAPASDDDIKTRARDAVAVAVAAGRIDADSTIDAVRFQVDAPNVPAWALRGAWEEARAGLDAARPPKTAPDEFEAPQEDHPGEPADPSAWDEPSAGVRPVIQIRPGELTRMIHDTIKALGQADENLFQRGGQLVRIVREPERREAYEADSEDPKRHDYRLGNSIITRPGTPKLCDATPTLLERADACITWQRFDKRKGKEHEGEWNLSDPHPLVVKQIAIRGDWPGIRPIRGIIETPCLAPSGRIIVAPGYDEETSHFLLPSCNVGTIVDAPTQAHARAALFFLWREIACDFPFRGVGEPARNEANEDTDPDRALQFAKALESPDAFVGVAMTLTFFARLAIDGAIPGGMFEAAARGSGKSLQMHTIAMIGTGRAASVATFPTRDGKPNDEELEKVIMGYAQQAARVIAFDNIKGHLTGSSLEKAMTSVDNIEGRILGVTGQRTFAWLAMLLFSGNNMTTSDDIADRVLVSRVESPREEPRRRPASTFRHANLLDAIKAQRPRLVRAVLVILRSYLAAKRDGLSGVEEPTRGSFEAWARIVPGALAWAGGPDILRAFPEGGSGGDEESEAHATLLRFWRDDWQNARASHIHEAIFKDEHAKDGPPDAQLDEVRSAVRAITRTRDGVKPSAHVFSMRLWKLRGTIRDGRRIEAVKDSNSKTYTYRMVRLAR